MLDWVPRRVRFVSATRQPEERPPRRVSVRLERRSGEPLVGYAGDGFTAVDEPRHAAEATLEALRQMVGTDTRLELTGVAPVAALGHSFIIAVVKVSHGPQTRTLMGLCHSSSQLARDASLAVLDATNRFLGLS